MLDRGKEQLRRVHRFGIQLPCISLCPSRVTKREVVVHNLAVNGHSPPHAGERENKLVLAISLTQHTQRHSDRHVTPVGMLFRMEREMSFNYWHRAVRHLERRIVLAVPVQWIMLAEDDFQHPWNLD